MPSTVEDHDAQSVLSDNEDSEENSEDSSNEKETILLARKESRALRLLRALLALILISSTALASWLVFRFMRKAEQNAFFSEFTNFADKVLRELNANAVRRIQGVDALSVALTSYAKSVDATWPLVTVPDFGILGASTRAIANSSYAFMYPIVTSSTRTAWEKYSVENRDWMSEKPIVWDNRSELQGNISYDGGERRLELTTKNEREGGNHRNQLPRFSSGISEEIYEFTKEGPSKSEGPGPFLPFWQMSPPDAIPPIAINFNAISLPDIRSSMFAVIHSKEAVLSELQDYQVNKGDYKNYGQNFARKPRSEPYSNVLYPVFDNFSHNRSLVAILFMDFSWVTILRGILPYGANGVDAVVDNSCNQTITYRINGPEVIYLGTGDLHDRSFDSLETTLSLNHGFTSGPNGVEMNALYCPYTVRVYPSRALHEAYITNKPIIMTVIVVAIFGFTSLVFFTYDRLVERRQSMVMKTAVRSNRIVSSLFPSNVHDRLFQINEPPNTEWNGLRKGFNLNDGRRMAGSTPRNRLSIFLSGEDGDGQGGGCDLTREFNLAKPIADLFPNATVLFADISGFTAWSSAREPSQVFTLLETVYSAFDKIAKRKGVFKVETIGDCYMAVTGVPEPQDDHAVIMAQFAQDCLVKMSDVTRKLEVTLGPDTADLSVRIGIHSGPVTAGVLRSEKSRFQLFGDTVNTASRMESTGQKNRIQISQETADLLYTAGKQDLISAREEKVFAKGKGELNTFWLDPKRANQSIGRAVSSVATSDKNPSTSSEQRKRAKPTIEYLTMSLVEKSVSANQSKLTRLVQWNTEVLHRPLKAIVAHRDPKMKRRREKFEHLKSSRPRNDPDGQSTDLTLLDEVVEIIPLPPFDRKVTKRNLDVDAVDLGQEVNAQLLDYVLSIASLYQDNPFHNFEHASHVTMSANKLLQRIVALDDMEHSKEPTKSRRRNSTSHVPDNTFGIASDPLVQFAILFAALIHDVDHPGVPNGKLIELKTDLALRYQNKSIAEQNSVDLAWKLLMSPKYDELRKCIASTEHELQRFRQLVVNLVMATDVLDRELQELRKNRWTKAFHDLASNEDGDSQVSKLNAANRKATIVIEHIIQASDVAHTMQHWQMFAKWNERLFREIYMRYLTGGGDTDPSMVWYQRELDFFDGYVIPLANKLKDCGVFGVSGDEYLTYATENRREWAQKGLTVVRSMVLSCQQDFNNNQ